MNPTKRTGHGVCRFLIYTGKRHSCKHLVLSILHLDGGFKLLVSQTEILENFINLKDSETSRPRKTPNAAIWWGEAILSGNFIHLRSRFAWHRQKSRGTTEDTCTALQALLSNEICLTWPWHAKLQCLGISGMEPCTNLQFACGTRQG